MLRRRRQARKLRRVTRVLVELDVAGTRSPPPPRRRQRIVFGRAS